MCKQSGGGITKSSYAAGADSCRDSGTQQVLRLRCAGLGFVEEQLETRIAARG